MKVFGINTAAILSALLISVNQVSANFHVSSLSENGVLEKYIACPSNYFNCDCFTNGDRSGTVAGDVAGGDFFQVESGLCGMPQMNFYKNGDGSWDFYAAGGDGDVLGQCYGNGAEDFCGSKVVDDRLVCYSYVCGS
jgi:hypothetical protein